MLLAAIVAIAAVAGCTSSAPPVVHNQTQDAYLDAYTAGMDYHTQAQDDFNNGTAAWEAEDLGTAIACYANASAEYGDAANCYSLMVRYATDPQDRAFAESLRGCTSNLSLAADDFANAAVAVENADMDTASDRFDAGQARINDSEELLGRSISLTPDWLADMASG